MSNNGFVAKSLEISEGVQQGDPIYLFLFVAQIIPLCEMIAPNETTYGLRILIKSMLPTGSFISHESVIIANSSDSDTRSASTKQPCHISKGPGALSYRKMGRCASNRISPKTVCQLTYKYYRKGSPRLSLTSLGI